MASNNGTNKTGSAARRSYKIAGLALLVVAIGVVVIWLKVVRGGEDPMIAMATAPAKRGPLVISVLESGAIKAKEQEVIRNEVEGRTSIVSIVPEGTAVKKGDELVKLDVSTLSDTRIDQEIKMNNAEAALINAQETLKITESQGQSDVDKAELALQFAKQDLGKYVDPNGGQYANLLDAAKNTITISKEELKRASFTLEWSERLAKEKYLSTTELQADQLKVKQAEVKLELAQNDLTLLDKFTKLRQVAQLESDVKQGKMALDRAIAKKNANDVQAKADLEAKEQEYKRQVAKLTKVDDQIKKATIVSPAEGMVVYATSSRGGFGREDRQPLAEGVTVFERQELIYIPKSTSSVAEVDVHEASLDKVHPGLPAVVTVDAIPDKKFVGTVARIAPLPNAQSMWMNPDLKIYTTNINLEMTDSGLRSGMSCKADIIVEQYTDVVHIPIQAVIRVKGQPTVYVVKDGELEERKVEIGLDNNTDVVIKKGLSEGEIVLLTPPLKEAAMDAGERIAGAGADGNDPMARRISEKLKAANGTEAGAPPAGTGAPQVSGPGQGPQGGQGLQMPTAEQMQRVQNMTPEERQKAMDERLKSMTPEQRQQAEQMRQRFQNMTPEERDKMRQQRRGGQDRGQGGGPGSGGGGNGTGPGPGGSTGGAGPGSDQQERKQ
jgi:HlyD family secretion protein